MRTLDALFAPRGVAVVGASRDGAKLGAVMARSLAGYADGPLLVNSRRAGDGVFASVAEAVAATSRLVDLAVLCVPAPACADALAEAATAGVRAAVVCAGGFAEAGPEGARHQAALACVAAEHGVRLLGPNTSGFLVPRLGLTASFVPAAGDVPAGPVAVVAASGGVNHALAFDLANSGVGVSLAVGIGAGVDVAAPDVLDHLVEDPATTAVGLHVETVPDGAALLAAVRRLVGVKPVVALVVGRSDVGAFARSHTGALATSWRTTRAVLRQAGAVLVDDEREMVDALTALCRARLAPQADPGVGVVTAQAGPGLLLVDRLRTNGVRVPELGVGTRARLDELLPPLTFQQNPVDTGRPDATFPAVLAAVAADADVSVLAGYALLEPDRIDLASAVHEARLPDTVPAVIAVGGAADQVGETRAQLGKLGVAAVTSPAAAANAVRALVEDSRSRAVAQPSLGPATASFAACLTAEGPTVDEAGAKDLLDGLGFATPQRRVCASRAEAHDALAELGGSVVVKILDAAVLHKTDVGGVHVGIETADELSAALAALDRIGARRYLVEAMAPPGVDLVVGTRRDPVFGPVVLLGLGGTAAEAIADVAIRAVPLSAEQAAGMVDELAGRELLRGFRGGPVTDERRLAELIATLGAALAASPHLAEIEINPLRVTADGLVALDAVVMRTEDADG
jgi:acyl-CoA synthetase (NDP forming)